MRKSVTLLLLAFTILVSADGKKIEKGKASYYADKFEGRKTASGEVYKHHLKTAAHKTLPFGTLVKVTNLKNNKCVVVRINDRGPFSKVRIIDLSKSAMKALDGIRDGVIDVEIEVQKKK